MLKDLKQKLMNKSGSYRFYKNHYISLKKDNEDNKNTINTLKNELNSQNHIISKLTDNKLNTSNMEENTGVQITNEEHLIFNEKIYDNQFVFSIIIPYYNSEKYLDQCITSIINQSINFKHNIQLILIDDGSTDNSLSIANKYKDKYPENIISLSQKHQNQSIARNKGLKHATGKLVNFLDSDDYFSLNTLEEVFKYFICNEQTDIINIPYITFGREDAEYENTKINDDELNHNMFLFLRKISASFFKNEIIKEILFDEKLEYFEGILFTYSLLLNHEFASINTGMLNVRKRYDYSSKMDKLSQKQNFKQYVTSLKCLYDSLTQLSINKSEKHILIEKLLINEIYIFLEYYLEEKNINEYADDLKNLLNTVSDKTIMESKFTKSFKILLIKLKQEGLCIEKTDSDIILKNDNYKIDSLTETPIYLNDLNVKENTLNISASYNTFFDINLIQLELIKTLDDTQESYSYNFIEKFQENNYSNHMTDLNTFEVSVPLDNEENFSMCFKVTYNDKLINKSYKPNISLEHFKKIENINIKGIPYFVNYKDNKITLEKGFNFSIIIAVYNVEKYLDEAINSVINQTLDFENNVQLILVDDGSTDNSYSIAKEYEQEYPENIKVLKQANQGQAVARNKGLEYAKGKYINFLDSDDYISENTLKEVLQFFNYNQEEIDMVAIPIKMFERLNKYHVLQKKFSSTRIIDLKTEPNNPQLSASSAFFKKELFPKFKFAEDMVTSEDSIMINKILLEKQKYGVVSTVTYYYRKRYDSSSTIDNSIYNKEFYAEKIRNYFLELIEYAYSKTNTIPLFIQYLIAYDIQWIIQEPEIQSLNESEKKEFKQELRKVFDCLDQQVFSRNIYIQNEIFRNYALSLITKDSHINVINDNVNYFIGNKKVDTLKNHRIWLDIVELQEDYLNISGFLNSYFSHENIKICAVKYDDEENLIEEYECKRVEYTGREDTVFIDQTFHYKYNFDITIPLDKNEVSDICIVTKYEDGELSTIENYLELVFAAQCRLSLNSNYIAKGSHILLFNNNKFQIRAFDFKLMKQYEKSVIHKLENDKPYNYKKNVTLHKIYYYCYYLKQKLFKKPIYLFMDRINMAGDNAETLFRYAAKQDDNIRKYYVIDNPNENNRLKKYGKIIKYKSFKHKLLYLLADKVISSHPDESVLNPFFDTRHDQRRYVSGLITSRTYFLQHGVTLGNVSDWLHKYDKNLSLIVTLSQKEHDSFLEKGYNYDEEIIQTLGFPRYDTLKNNRKKQIIIIPTWRSNLENNENLFKNSDYFNNIQKMLTDKKLINYLDEKGYNLVFKPHPRLFNKIPGTDKRFVDLFEVDDKVKLSTKDSYQKIFEDSDLLITDYSSVAFDFAYLKKPIIYYQPNDDYHHGKSYFEFESMGFGNVLSEEKQLSEKIQYYLDNNCEMEDKYIQRVDEFFKFTDKNNSKRVYEWILNH